MSTTKTFYAYFDFPGTIKINSVAATIYAVIQTPDAKQTSMAKQASSAKIQSAQPAGNELYCVEIIVPENEYSEYYYFLASITSYYDIGGKLHTIGADRINVMAIFTQNDTNFYIGPQSTVASVYAFAQRMICQGVNWQKISASRDFVQVAYAMMNNFYITGGRVSKVISSPPNDMQTNSFAVYNFLSTLLYYCLVDSDVLTNFLKCVNTIPGISVTNSLDAIIAVAQNPFDNVKEIYDLIAEKPDVYTPSLRQIKEAGFEPIPDQWTLAIKVNDSGALNFLIAGTAYTVFDKDNKAWVTNNFRQGTPNSGGHCMVFNPDGSPADISPIMGGGILGPGFGVAVNPTGDTIAFGNYGWGSKDYNPVTGSISVFSSDGAVLSPPNGFTKGLCRVQGMCYDQSGNLWMASWGTQAPMEDPTGPHIYNVPAQPSAVVCYLDGDPNKPLIYNDFNGKPKHDGTGKSEYNGTFGVVMDKDGNCIVSNAGTSKKMASSVYKVRISEDRSCLEYVAHWDSDWASDTDGQVPGFEELRQPQIDIDGSIYVGGITSCRVVKLNGDTLEKEAEIFNNVYGPWGITIDSKGKKFVTGFGAKYQAVEDIVLTYERAFGITVVEPGDATWAENKLMTLPSGGAEVTLANGQRLYGNQIISFADDATLPNGEPLPEAIIALNGKPMPPSYSPLMRTTSTAIDRAGNLWCANNWKPSLYSDVFTNTDPNPGGDGMVIFVGVAEPLAPLS